MRKRVSFILKILTFAVILLGVVLNLIYAKYDGYSHWTKRLFYFTTQSNLWIVIMYAILIVYPFTQSGKAGKGVESVYTAKYIFSVSIAMTGIVYCCFLGPFADSSYHPWSINSLLSHAIGPVLATVEFFVDDTPIKIDAKRIWAVAVPSLCYFLLVMFLSAFNFDFGRGEPYPYFFMNFHSPAGFFGFSNVMPYMVGTFYWILLLLLMMLGVGLLFSKIKNRKAKK